MDILSQNNSASNFNSKTTVTEKVQKEKETLLIGNTKDGSVFRLNPLLNESLNNLVKRLERTKIPKPPPTKGQSIRKKSKLSNSLPNIFLPPGFDDHKYSNEKKVQWTNKLNLNLERLKNAFNDTYSCWCEQKRSQSIQNVGKVINENITILPPDLCITNLNTNVEAISTGLQNIYDSEIVRQRSLTKTDSWDITNSSQLERHSIISTDSFKPSVDIPSFSTHVYLDGAIIEPISPASPTCLAEPSSESQIKKIEFTQGLPKEELEKNTKPVPKKKGRPKKIQPPMLKSDDKQSESGSTVKPVKPILTKKGAKSRKTKIKEIELPSFSSDTTEDNLENTAHKDLQEVVTKPSLTKRQQKLSKQNDLAQVNKQEMEPVGDPVINDDFDENNEKPTLTKKQKKVTLRNKLSKSKNQSVDLPEVSKATGDNSDLFGLQMPENIQKVSPTKKLRRSTKSSVPNTLEAISEPEKIPDKLENVIAPVVSTKLFERVEEVREHISCTDDSPETILKDQESKDNCVDPNSVQFIESLERSVSSKKRKKLSKETKTIRDDKSLATEADSSNDNEKSDILNTNNVIETPKKQKQMAISSEIIHGDVEHEMNENKEYSSGRNLMERMNVLEKYAAEMNRNIENQDANFGNNIGDGSENFVRLVLDENADFESQVLKSKRLLNDALSTESYHDDDKPPDITTDNAGDNLSSISTEKVNEVPIIEKQKYSKQDIGLLANNNQNTDFSIESQLSNEQVVGRETSITPKKSRKSVKDTHKKTPRKLSKENETIDSTQADFDPSEPANVVCQPEISFDSKPKEEVPEKKESELMSISDTIVSNIESSLSKENIDSLYEKAIVSKLNKRGPKKSRKVKTNQEPPVLQEAEKVVYTTNEEKNTLRIDQIPSVTSIVEEETIPVDKRRRLQRTHPKPNPDILPQNIEVLNESVKSVPVVESPKKAIKIKPGPKCKKPFFQQVEDTSQIDPVEESVVESRPIEKPHVVQKLAKRGRPKLVIIEEPRKGELKQDLADNSTENIAHNEASKAVINEESQRVEVISPLDVVGDEDLVKTDPPGIMDQSNDIEVLSKSITDSVDTSMLPPRKRYKRLMYLDNSKLQTSPNEAVVIEALENTEVSEIISQDSAPNEDEVQTKKTTQFRSKLKIKKPTNTVEDFVETISSDDVAVDTPSTIDDSKEEIKHKEDTILTPSTTENVEKPNSLKRSKREAAARGFANMVAMSLNNSSQSHESTSDFSKKTIIIKVDSSDEVLPEISGGKVFKKPKKSTLSNIVNLKSKGKLSRSFDFTDEVDEEIEEPDIVKVLTKKQRLTKEKTNKDNPPSPGDTIVSNDGSSQDTAKYRKIRSNIYVDPKPTNWVQDTEKCGCKPSTSKHLNMKKEKCKESKNSALDIVWDCTDNCLNKLTYMECNSKSCPCGELCNNQKIRKLDWVTGLKVTDIPSKGRGVVTTKTIQAGTLIQEYVGEVVYERTFLDRLTSIYKEDAHHYCLHLDGDMLIDAYRNGSVARFVNHSCQPNCEMQKWMVNGAYRMCLFANEDVQADTELTFDYNFCSYNTRTTQICLCGAANCRGFIGGRPRLEETNNQKDRKRLLFAFGRTMSLREKLFVLRRAIFLVRSRILGRCLRLGICRTKQTHGLKLPSTITEIKRRKAKKNQFLTQMSALNSVRSIRIKLLQDTEESEQLTHTAPLALVLRDLYNSLLEQKDPLNPTQQLVAPFVKELKSTKYPEFYNMVGQDMIVSLNQVYSRLLDDKYPTMMAFDQDILQMIQNIELYAGKQSNIGKCAEQLKPIYKDLKMNAIALYEALVDEMVDDREKNKLLSNNLTMITNAVRSMTNSTESDQTDSTSQPKSKKRKQGPVASVGGSRGRLERGAEVIKCVCGFLIEAGHVMVQCDRCFVWQHAYCMNVARSSELVDVTRMEPYFCHICLNIPTESLVREIPRHFVITDETVASGNTLFWTLLHTDGSLLKIDDFVYIPSEEDVNGVDRSGGMIDLSQRTIMRIYSLWKDLNGQRWMEGGLFLRPYNGYIKSLSESRVNPSETSNKRKASTGMNLSTHKWHQQEVVYTDLTKILQLDVCVGRCHVLNNHTFRLGKPLIQNSSCNGVDDVYLCDWLINKSGEWSEIDPAYMKINMKPYCFERYTDGTGNEINNEKFLRQYTADELLKLDQGAMETCASRNAKLKSEPSEEDKRIVRLKQFGKLVTKLSEFACDRNRKLPLSPNSSVGSRSPPSSRDDSPVCQNVDSRSALTRRPRKQIFPKKTLVNSSSTRLQCGTRDCPEETTIKTIASEYSENSPKLIIVVDEDRVTRKGLQKVQEECSPLDDKSSDNVSSSPIEHFEERSNPCSEIKYGDLLDLLKETVPCKPKPGPKSRTAKWQNVKPGPKGKKKAALKKNVLKPVSEINAVDDNWTPTKSQMLDITTRRETRSRRAFPEEKVLVDDGSVVITSETRAELEENEDDSRKTCFVKLERIKVSRTEKNKQRKLEKNDSAINSSSHIPHIPSESNDNKPPTESSGRLSLTTDETKSENVSNQNTIAYDDTHNQNSSFVTCSNRSKRKKGVPKRIPFDFTYQPISTTIAKPDSVSGTAAPYDYEVVDLSAGKSSHVDKPDQSAAVECPKIDSPEISPPVPKLPKSILPTSETSRHITAANDFSSIENMTSN